MAPPQTSLWSLECSHRFLWVLWNPTRMGPAELKLPVSPSLLVVKLFPWLDYMVITCMIQLETVSNAEPLQNRQHAQNP